MSVPARLDLPAHQAFLAMPDHLDRRGSQDTRVRMATMVCQGHRESQASREKRDPKALKVLPDPRVPPVPLDQEVRGVTKFK